jgi:hyperosmotically inducible periplasmic protein
MIRALLRVVLVLIIVAAVAAFFFGYRFADRGSSDASEGATATSGAQVDVGSAREAGAKVGEKVAEGANQVQRAAADAALTAKIKSKMALDDTIQARNIDVDTMNGVVTLNGFVRDAQARERAVQLARETDGVMSVVDHLTIR